MDKADPVAVNRHAPGVVRSLVTIRMIRLFMVLRRAGILTQRRRFDLSEIEWRIMTQLGDTSPLSLNGLAEMLVQDRGQLSRAVKAMVARGLLTRKRKPGGPEIEIELSSEGKALHSEIIDWVFERDERLTAGIDQADLDVLRRLSGTMMERAEEMLEEEQQVNR